MDPDLQLADPAEIAVAQEYLSLKARIEEARTRADRLRTLAEHLDEQVSRDEHMLHELEGTLGLAAQLQIEQLDRELGGKRLQEIAIAVLSAKYNRVKQSTTATGMRCFAPLATAPVGRTRWPASWPRSTAPSKSSPSVDDRAAIVFARPSLVNAQSQSNWEHHDSRTCFLYAQSRAMCAKTAQPSQFLASQLHPSTQNRALIGP